MLQKVEKIPVKKLQTLKAKESATSYAQDKYEKSK
jgi:hypothetical protein